MGNHRLTVKKHGKTNKQKKILFSNKTSFQELLLKRSVEPFSTSIIFKTFNESSLLNEMQDLHLFGFLKIVSET